jgi:hypothetical protein
MAVVGGAAHGNPWAIVQSTILQCGLVGQRQICHVWLPIRVPLVVAVRDLPLPLRGQWSGG